MEARTDAMICAQGTRHDASWPVRNQWCHVCQAVLVCGACAYKWSSCYGCSTGPDKELSCGARDHLEEPGGCQNPMNDPADFFIYPVCADCV